MEQDSIIGLDIAKTVFQVHRTDASGAVVECRRLRRGALLGYFADLPASLVGLEACASAHHWARSIAALGHEVRLIAPSYVKPYVQRQKNDAADAAAIAEAVSRPHMRFVPVKSVVQQGALMLHRVRDLLIKQRTMTINALRAHLAELGIVSAKGREGVTALIAHVNGGDGAGPLDALARSALLGLVAQLRGLHGEITVLDRRILAWHRDSEVSRRLASIPGIGVLNASALAATLGDGSAFGGLAGAGAPAEFLGGQGASGSDYQAGRSPICAGCW